MKGVRGTVLIGLGVALLVAMGLPYLASGEPDGLESAVLIAACDGDEDCLDELAGEPAVAGLDPDYASGWVGGLAGVAATFLVISGLLLAVRRRDGGQRSPG